MTQRDRIVLAVFAAVAVIAASWMLAIKPKRQEAAELADRAAQAQQRRDAALAKLANAKQAEAQFAQAQVNIARMGKAVPSDDDVATLVYQLERTARKAGIDFRSLTQEPGAANPTPGAGAGTANPTGVPSELTPVPFKLTFEGTFFQLRRFIDHVNSFTTVRGEALKVRGRLMSVDGVSLAASRLGFPSLKAQITTSAYLAPDPAKSAAAATPATPGTAPATPAPAPGATPAPTTATVSPGVAR